VKKSATTASSSVGAGCLCRKRGYKLLSSSPGAQPVDFVADQARPGLSQSEAPSQLARQLAPVTREMLALFEPACWPATWADMQAVLHARSAERSPQFMQWWQVKKKA